MTTANPVPLINQPLVPDAVKPGGLAFVLTVNGTGFVSSSVVRWNGSPPATTFVSRSQLRATVPSSNIMKPSTTSVTVFNPKPGGGRSNVIFFEVTPGSPSVAMTASSLSAGSGPISAVAADFNSDGKLDLAVANDSGNNVSIFLGNGNGTFKSPVNYAVGTEPSSGMATADFNGDGKLDLVVANYGSNNVSVLLGNGDGTFRTAVNYDVGAYPAWVAVGDFNRDGKLDLAVADRNCNGGPPCPPGFVSILLGNGDGTFQAHVDYDAGMAPSGVAVGDYSRDGKLDLAVVNGSPNASQSTVSILLGNGDGTFQSLVSYLVGINGSSVATADFNGDGQLDLAVANYASVSILLGNGQGTFQIHVDYTIRGSASGNPGIADFNADGKLDFAVTSPSSVQIFLGKGDGTFQSPLPQGGTGSQPGGAVPGDFKQDGTLYVAIPNLGDNTVSLLEVVGTVVEFNPTSLDLGIIPVGGYHNMTTTLTNAGSTALNINSITITGTDEYEFSQTNTCGSSVGAGK